MTDSHKTILNTVFDFSNDTFPRSIFPTQGTLIEILKVSFDQVPVVFDFAVQHLQRAFQIDADTIHAMVLRELGDELIRIEWDQSFSYSDALLKDMETQIFQNIVNQELDKGTLIIEAKRRARERLFPAEREVSLSEIKSKLLQAYKALWSEGNELDDEFNGGMR